MIRPKKSILVSANQPGETFLSLTLPNNRICFRIYISNWKKDKEQRKLKKKKRISAENLIGCDNIVCEFALCTFNLLDWAVNFSWLYYVQREKYSICYTATTYKVHTQELK